MLGAVNCGCGENRACGAAAVAFLVIAIVNRSATFASVGCWMSLRIGADKYPVESVERSGTKHALVQCSKKQTLSSATTIFCEVRLRMRFDDGLNDGLDDGNYRHTERVERN